MASETEKRNAAYRDTILKVLETVGETGIDFGDLESQVREKFPSGIDWSGRNFKHVFT